jgi:Cu2+-containing amine oxidase
LTGGFCNNKQRDGKEWRMRIGMNMRMKQEILKYTYMDNNCVKYILDSGNERITAYRVPVAEQEVASMSTAWLEELLVRL